MGTAIGRAVVYCKHGANKIREQDTLHKIKLTY